MGRVSGNNDVFLFGMSCTKTLKEENHANFFEFIQKMDGKGKSRVGTSQKIKESP